MRTIGATTELTGRTLLTRIGIGQFNATMVIPYLGFAPATTDPKSPQVIIMVQHVQKMLNQMGAALSTSGHLDIPTARTLSLVVGERWETMPWSATLSAIISAKDNGVMLPTADETEILIPPAATGDIPGVPFLPDVPGGILTYGVAAYLLYRYLKKK